MLAQSVSYACLVIAAMVVCLPFPWWYLWHRRRKRQREGWTPHLCAACGFSYTGPPEDTACPECGSELSLAEHEPTPATKRSGVAGNGATKGTSDGA